MKNRVSTLVTILLVVFMVSACVPKPGGPTDPSATPTIEQTSSAGTPGIKPTPEIKVDISKLKGLQIHFLQPWAGATQEELALLVDQFNQSNQWGIHVIMDSAGSAGRVAQTMWENLNTDKSPNVVVAPVSLFLALDEKEHRVVDLSRYIYSQKYGLESGTIQDFLPVFWEEDQMDGKQYAIPAQRTTTIMLYNITWGHELGFDEVPSTPGEFKEQTCAANASMRKDELATNDGLGGWIINTSSTSLLNWLAAFGSQIHGKSGFTFNTSETMDAFTYLSELTKASCAWKSSNPQPYNYFTNRQTLVYSGELQDIERQVSAMQRTGVKDAWQVIPYPGETANPVVTSGQSYGILRTDEEKDLAAWLFIRWLSDPVQQAAILRTAGTLPLGKLVLPYMTEYSAAHVQWSMAVEILDDLVTQPQDADWQVISPVLEDAGWQLFQSDSKPDQVQAILEQLDAIALELSERYP